MKDQAKEQAGQVADTAKEQAAGVAASAQEQASNVLGEAKDQAVDLFADLKTQLGEQSDAVRDRLAQFLVGVGSELSDMASSGSGAGGGSGYATQVVRQVGDRASSWGSHLSNHDSSDLLDQTRALARRKPGTFLLGAVLAGVVAGRVTRGAKAHHDETTASTPARTTTSSTAQPAASQHSTYEVDAIVERTRPVDPYGDVAAPLDPRDPRNPLAPLDPSRSGEYRP